MYTAVIQIITLTCEAVPPVGEICAKNYIQIPQNLKVKRITINVQADLNAGTSYPALLSTKESQYANDYVLIEAADKYVPPQGYKFEVTSPEQNITTGFYLASAQNAINDTVVVSILFEGEL